MSCDCSCDGLILLECFTTLSADELKSRMPPFLDIIKNVTGDPEYSMFNLSLKSDSSRNDAVRLQKEASKARIAANGITGGGGSQDLNGTASNQVGTAAS